MSRSKWSVVFASLTALGLLFCQNVARGEESETAPPPPDVGNSAPAQKCDVAKDAACCVQQACGGDCCNCRHWIIDVDAVFLAPIQNQHFGVAGLATVNEDQTMAAVTESAFTRNDCDFTVSPRIALGVQGECWGVLVRYWQLENGNVNAQFANVLGPGDGAGYQSGSAFQAKTLDLEVTRLLGCCDDGWQFQASGGVRYAELHEAANLSFSETVGADSFYQTSVFARHDFNGAGVTLGLQGVRPVPCSCFNLFFDARVSWLFDSDAGNYVATSADWLGANGDAHQFNQALSTSNANLFIGEIQVGGQWNLPLKCIPANAFVRVAFEYQYWCTSNAGAAEAFSIAGPTGGPVGFAAGSSAGDTHVNLVGFNIGTGLTW